MVKIQSITEDRLILHANYFEKANTSTAVIYLHGFMDEYEYTLSNKIVQSLINADISVLQPQLRGSGVKTIFKKSNEDKVEIGSFYELLEEANLDISMWIELLISKGYKRIVLVGHSIGAIKSVRYLFEGEYKEKISRLILLSPFDKNGYLEERHPKE